MKEAFTTGEVAKYCGVNFRTVIRWIEKGYMDAYKLPGRGDNRIPVESLVSFLTKNSMPIPEEIQLLLTQPSSEEKPAKIGDSPRENEKIRVLVIEDEELMAKSMVRSIARAGYEVDVAINGIEAGIKLEVFKPHILTLDLQMPGMSGFEVLEALDSNDKYEHIKVLRVSASAKIKLIKAMSLKVDDTLEKPFKSEDLLEKLAAIAVSV